MKRLPFAGLAALAFVFAACAPSASPAQKALDKAPMRKGEVWALNAISADGKTKRLHNVEVTGTAEYDPEATEVYIDAKVGELEALTFYDPDSEQQGVLVYLDKNKDPVVTWCDFSDARRGVTKLQGVSFLGARSKLKDVIQSGRGFGVCTLQKIK